MAVMIDEKPGLAGEARVWESIANFLPDNVIVYHNREINGREFDFCLFFENQYILFIEVKGWQSGAVHVQDANHIAVDGYAESLGSPKQQARIYRFAMLNRIREEYGHSPLVLDMVCYPFISRTEYLQARLDLCSEENFTLFKEELEDGTAFIHKLALCYDAMKGVPHDPFTVELMRKLRITWEPDVEISPETPPPKDIPYSMLCVYPKGMMLKAVSQAVTAYFSGTKQLLFVGDREEYLALVQAFDRAFRERNTEPVMDHLYPGYAEGLKPGESATRAFNLEIYYSERLSEICQSDWMLIEGPSGEEDCRRLNRLSEVTSFNAKQFLVEHAPVDTNMMVLAGAGTGKTRTMTSRIAFMCNRRDCPVDHLQSDIAMVTFTNDAADNMKARLKQLFTDYFVLTGKPKFLELAEEVNRAQISTIHSFAKTLLQNASLCTGMGINFRISSDQYAREAIYTARLGDFIAHKEEDNPDFSHQLPVPLYELRKKLMALADRLLTKGVNPESIQASELGVPVGGNFPYFNKLIMDVLIPAELQYLESLRGTNSIDLKELMSRLDEALDHKGWLRQKYRCVFIDEFQDTDDEQIRIFCKLQRAMGADCRLFVVGDLKQSIYRFRGAQLSAFDLLRKGSTGKWTNFDLTINYRTDKRLLHAYEAIFERMAANGYLPYDAMRDRLTSGVEFPLPDARVWQCVPVHGRDENHFAARLVEVLRRQEAELAELMRQRKLSRSERTIAVLVRKNYQVGKVVAAARRGGIVMETKSGGDLFQLAPAHDLYKLLLALTHGTSVVHLVNFIESNYTDLSPEYWKLHGHSYEERLALVTGLLDTYFTHRLRLSWAQLLEQAYTQPILFVLKQIYDATEPWAQFGSSKEDRYFYATNYECLLEEITNDARVETLTLDSVMEYMRINILTRQQKMSREPETDDDGIHFICTTVHKSKGLEYGTVVLPYNSEGIGDVRRTKLDANYINDKLAYLVTFENGMKEVNSNYKIEEELQQQICDEMRILYVALTRAMHNCIWMKDVDRDNALSWQAYLEV